MSTQIKKIHIAWIDSAKAISILGVVYIHIALPFNSYFRFCVPIFIITSFYLTELFWNTDTSKYREPVLTFYQKRLIRLVFPYIVWSIFYQLLEIINNPNHVQFYIDHPLKIFVGHWTGTGWPGQYYFIVLIQLTLIYPVIRRFNINKFVLIGIVSAIYVLLYIPIQIFQIYPFLLKLGDISFLNWLPYLLMGIFFAREDIKNRIKVENGLTIITKKNQLIFFLLLYLIPVLIVLESSIYQLINIEVSPYFYVSLLIVSPGFFKLFYDYGSFDKFWLNHKFTSFSKYTLGIFCLNPFLNQVFGTAFSESANKINIDPNFNRFIVLILTLTTAWLLSRFLSRFRFISMLVK